MKKYNLYNILFYSITIIVCIFIYTFFRKLDATETDKIVNTVKVVVRKEVNNSDPYELSKSLVDLEQVKLFKCVSLKNIIDNKYYYNTTSSSYCSSIFYKTKYEQVLINSLNGNTYQLVFAKYLNITSFSLELILYLLTVILNLLYLKFHTKRQQTLNDKIKILEIERLAIDSKNKKITHDISSPLSALRMITSLLTNIDPEIKNIMNNALTRTNDIFNDLRVSQQAYEKTDLIYLFKRLIEEKKLISANYNIMYKLNNSLPSQYLFASLAPGVLERVISNILNNSIDSFKNKKPINQNQIIITLEDIKDHILITIVDTGCGISDENLRKIGKESFSFGKEKELNSGMGIGVLSSFDELNRIGWSIEYDSTVNQGTTVSIRIPKSLVFFE